MALDGAVLKVRIRPLRSQPRTQPRLSLGRERIHVLGFERCDEPGGMTRLRPDVEVGLARLLLRRRLLFRDEVDVRAILGNVERNSNRWRPD